MNLIDVDNLVKYMHTTYLKAWYNNTLPFRFSKVAEENEEIRLSEKMIQAIWNDRKFLKENLKDDHKRDIKILNPGTWNREPGPDFKNALIEIKGQAIKGDIEIHLSPGHWKAHGHQYDPAYNKVILHVVWEMRGYKFPPDIPHLELSSQLSVSCEKVLEMTNLVNYSKSRMHAAEECSELINKIPDSSLKTVFQAAGLSRMHRKSHSFRHKVNMHGLNQAFYIYLSDALGYKNNRVAFKKLSQTANLSTLKNLRSNEERISFLWGKSGLLPDYSQEKIHSDLKPQATEKWKVWWKLRKEAENDISWNRTSQRPLNSPERRLAALECLLVKTNFEPEKVLQDCLKKIHDHQALKKYLHTFFEINSPWEHFCNFKTKLKSKSKLIGESRKLDIIINVILPALATLIDETDSDSLNSLYLFYCKLPKSQNNHILDIASHKFFIPPYRSKQIIKHAVEQQGLIQLMQDFELSERSEEIISFWDELGIDISFVKNEILTTETV